jgi:hypothetical protein
MLYLISQVGIVVFGISSSFLIARKNKWGFVLALLAQPFWLVIGWVDGSWGVLVLTAVYTTCSSYGIYTWFFKDMFDYAWIAAAIQMYDLQRAQETVG